MVFERILPLPGNLLAKNETALLIGKEGTCKTSFVFRYCHSIAEHYSQREVVYICPVKLFEMPLSVEGMDPFSAATAQRVNIFYPATLEDLVEYLAKFFTLNLIPCAFIVDDLDFIIKRKRRSSDQTFNDVLSRVFALLVDNVEHVRTISGQTCELLVATSFDVNTIEEYVIMKTIGEHFFEEIYTIKEHDLLESTTGKGFAIISTDESYKIIVHVQDDLIKLKQVLRKKAHNEPAD